MRYMLILMALFSIYNGVIYNEFAGFELNLFGSCYKDHKKICTYSFGIDPAWAG
jgi:V-type ATPase 116kDa subunit family